MSTIEYDFNIGDRVYVLDCITHSINEGTVCQFEGDVYPVGLESVTRKQYLVVVDGEGGTTEVLYDSIFATKDEARLALSAIFTPTPTPTNTATPTPTPTVSMSPTPAVTPSVTPNLPDIFFPMGDAVSHYVMNDSMGKTYGLLQAPPQHTSSNHIYQDYGPTGITNAHTFISSSMCYPFGSSMLNTSNNGLSVFLWFKSNSIYNEILNVGQNASLFFNNSGKCFFLRTFDNKGTAYLEIEIFIDGGFNTIVSFSLSSSIINVANNSWHHIGFTYDGTTLRLYGDGVELDNVGGGTGNINIPNQTMGYMSSDSSTLFTGTQVSVNNVKIWSTVLSPTTIAQEYLSTGGA